ncbi:MAG: MarR family transcriptional regulator [Burkholderiaceae bacterium]|jgi:DNA-binding MarR family transcriptional regulator|nr:MarR family transcriptional regulator [Burkholderiaceae bacterium]
MAMTPSPAVPHNPLLLDHQLCFALYSASLAMTRLYKPLLDALGLTYPQYLALLVLWEQDGIGVSALGERLGLDSGTVTPLLKRLEAHGSVRRQRSTLDERSVLVFLTDAGAQLRLRAQAIPACLMQATGCSPPELVTLTRELRGLRDRLNLSHTSPSALPADESLA